VDWARQVLLNQLDPDRSSVDTLIWSYSRGP
jgi:hypothetical protein